MTAANTPARRRRGTGKPDTASLIPGELEIALSRALLPGAFQGAMVGGDIFQLAFRRDVDGLAGRVLRIRLDADRPVCEINVHASDGDRIRAWINEPCDVLPIPVHHHSDSIALGWGRAPITGPGAGKRMSLLGRTNGHEGQPETSTAPDLHTHHNIRSERRPDNASKTFACSAGFADATRFGCHTTSSLPSSEVSTPPASRTHGTTAAMSHGFMRGSSATSTRPWHSSE